MKNLFRSYKTEIDPTEEQKIKINRTSGTCRFVYNLYLGQNQKSHAAGKGFISGMTFHKWLNNEFIPQNEQYKWIKEVSSKSVKRSIMDGDSAFKKFFKKKAGFPKFKKKGKGRESMYFVRNNPGDCLCERHRIKIPTLGWVKLKEKGYIPTDKIIKSGTVFVKAGRYYVSALVEEPEPNKPELNHFGLGVDLGIKELAVVSNGYVYHNINKTARIKKLNKRLRHAQRRLSRMYENLKNRKGEATRKNIQKQVLKVQKLYQWITDIREDHINKTIAEIVKTKPSYIVIEDLNVSGMMKNKHLSKAVQAQKFYSFRTKLQNRCRNNGIELRIVDRWYPSSKRCHCCGAIKKDMKLSDRIYRCECGYCADRDFNASLNLRDAETYNIA